MTMAATIMVWAAAAIAVVLLALAIAHVIQGLRYAHGDRQILIATLAFVLIFTIIIGTTAVLLRHVDWQQPWSFSQPDISTESFL